MTFEIILVVSIIAITMLLFASEIIRIDLVALLVLLALVFTGLVRPDQALSGFSNPAVVTVWAMFILSAGLMRTGVSAFIGAQVLRLAGRSETRLVAVLMSFTALLSAVMNNTGVAAMFLPITLEISQRINKPPSRLLLPMAYGSLLGGLVLLIGTASNLVVRDAMRDAGYIPLGMFDFTPGGMVILIVSTIYMSVIGRRFLPIREAPHPFPITEYEKNKGDHSEYGLEERLAILILPVDSTLAGKTLIESRIGRALGINVLSIKRKNGTRLPAEPDTIFEGGDRLLVLGRLDRIEEISHRPLFIIERDPPALDLLMSGDGKLAEFKITDESPFANQTLTSMEFRSHYGCNVLAIRHDGTIKRTHLQNLIIQPGDYLVVYGSADQIEQFTDQPHFRFLTLDGLANYHFEHRILAIRIPPESPLIGRSLSDSRLGSAYGLTVIRIFRQQEWITPHADTSLMPDDLVLIGGRPIDIEILHGLQNIQVVHQVPHDFTDLQFGSFLVAEVMLSPHTSLNGKTLRDLRFREKYGISVLSIWRGDRAFRSDLANMPLQYGDALLCYGPQEKFKYLASERDFVVLKTEVQEKPRMKKAPIAILVMVAVLLSTIFGGFPISIAAIAGSVLMVLSGCITMDEAYQSIDWRSIFLIAAMLPLGIALQETGAAALLGSIVVNLTGGYGPSAVLAGLMVLSMIATQFMPSPVIAVIMSPIALTASLSMGVSPYPYILGVAYALAASFLSPAAHPANILVMSPGGYRFTDYLKHGFPISLIVLVISILILPVIFPY